MSVVGCPICGKGSAEVVRVMDPELLPGGAGQFLLGEDASIDELKAQGALDPDGSCNIRVYPELGGLPYREPWQEIRLYRYREDAPEGAKLVTVRPVDGDVEDACDYITGWVAIESSK